MLGSTEWVVIGVAAMMLFGAPKVIEWAKALGMAKKEFDKAKKEDNV